MLHTETVMSVNKAKKILACVFGFWIVIGIIAVILAVIGGIIGSLNLQIVAVAMISFDVGTLAGIWAVLYLGKHPEIAVKGKSKQTYIYN